MKTNIITSTGNKTSIEVELPYYSRYGTTLFYKVTDEKTCTGVSVDKECPHILTLKAESGLKDDNIPCTEQEFEEAINKAYYLLFYK